MKRMTTDIERNSSNIAIHISRVVLLHVRLDAGMGRQVTKLDEQ